MKVDRFAPHSRTRALFTAALDGQLLARLQCRVQVAMLANEAPGGSLYDQDHGAEQAEFAGLANEVTVDERGWAIVPFGDWPHELGMQKFHREQAEAIANAFNAIAGRLKRAVCGLPIFKGHPDVPALANQYPDKTEKGQIAAVEVRPEGMALKLILSEAGADLVAKGWKFISPFWLANVIAVGSDGRKTFAPSVLRSVGLVSKPNIPSPSLANAASAANHKTTMDPEMLKLLGLAENATPAQIVAAIKTLHTNAGSLANEQSAHTTAKTALTTAEGKIVLLENAAKTHTTDLTAAQTALANERKARVDDAVALAIRTGRCLEAEKETWTNRLLANWAAESVALANAAPKVKTASEIPDMLKALQKQMEAGLENAGKKDAKAGQKGTDADADDDDDGQDSNGLGNADYAKMDHKARGKLMDKAVTDEQTKLGNTPHPSKYNAAFANAKKANPRLFGFKQSDVAKD